MAEFLRVLRTLTEFPLTAKSATSGDWHRWQWRFRDEPTSVWTHSLRLSRFYICGMPRPAHVRYRDVVESHRRLSRRLITAVERVIGDG